MMIFDMIDWLEEQSPSHPNTFNQYSLESVKIDFNPDDVKLFNRVYKKMKSSNLNKIIRTASGSICQSGYQKMINCYAWDVRYTQSSIIMTILIGDRAWSFKVGHIDEETGPASGRKAFIMFRAECKKFGIDINDYADKEHGLMYKAEIEKPLIVILDKFCGENIVLNNVNHLDFHSSYPAGLCNCYPEFRPVVEQFYKARKINPLCKLVLNATIGYFQSWQTSQARWAKLSRDAIKDNNDRIRSMAAKLELSGRTIVGFNTDGIWYMGEPYHGPGEGTKLGEWCNDHVNCKFRAKSIGCYEYEEDGVYTPVVRGLTRLDRLKSRKDWKWGDIFKDAADVIRFKFDEEQGIVLY